jgi:hypothetical protein
MTTIKFRRDTSANWTSVNPIPAQGEPCYETDTGKLKIGNGSDNYVTLPYVSDGGGSGGNLPIASSTTLGGVKVGDNLSVTEDGVLSASSEAKTVKTPSGHIKLDDGGLHNDDNSRAIINRSSDQGEVRVGNGYEPTVIDGYSIKLNSSTITDKDGNTFLSGDTINGVKFYTDTSGNATVANVSDDSNRLSLTGGGCNLYDSDSRKIFGSAYSSSQTRTDWSFAHQSDTVRIANDSNGSGEGVIIKTPSGGTSPTIGYTYYGTDADLYGKEQAFLRTEDVDNSTIKIVDGKLTASGGDYIKTTQVATGGLSHGVYLNRYNGNKLDTIQPRFNTFGGALKTSYINYLKAPTYSSSEPADEDMSNNWTDKNGFLTGFTTSTGFISSGVKFVAGSGSLQIIFKLMEAGYIAGIDQDGDFKFSKIEISTDGTTYTEYHNTTSNAKYIRFTFDYSFTDVTYVSFLTRIRTIVSNIAGGECMPLSVSVDDKTIKIVNDKLVGNITSDMIDATYMKVNDNGKLSVDTAAVAHLAMPSTASVNLTLGASGTSYTAPADGYISVSATSTYTGWIKVDTRPGCYGYANDGQFLTNTPVVKDVNFKVWYSFSSGNVSTLQYAFYYCNGTVPTDYEPDF